MSVYLAYHEIVRAKVDKGGISTKIPYDGSNAFLF